MDAYARQDRGGLCVWVLSCGPLVTGWVKLGHVLKCVGEMQSNCKSQIAQNLSSKTRNLVGTVGKAKEGRGNLSKVVFRGPRLPRFKTARREKDDKIRISRDDNHTIIIK